MEKRKIYGTILGGIAFIAVIIAATYASYIWRSDETDLSFSISDSYFYCESGIDSEIESLSPVLDYRNGSYKSFFVNNIGLSDTTFSITLNIKTIADSLKNSSFKYKIMLDSSGGSNACNDTSESDCVEVAEGNFSNAVIGMNTLAESVTLPNNSKYEYYLFLYLDGNSSNNGISGTMTYTIEVCEIVAFFDYNGGTGDKEYLKITDTYDGLPEATKANSTLSFNSNGGTSVSSSTVTHTFAGWYLEDTFTTKVEEDDPIAEDLTTNHTLHAKWNMTDTSGTTTDGCITLPTDITRTGYTFKGWYKESSLTNKVEGQYCFGRDDEPKDITLYAKWVDEEKPVASVTTTSTLKSGSQTATLTCTDTVGVTKYYWGTSSDGTPATTITSTKSMSTTTTVSSAGTYYLRCQDAAGNISTTTSSSTVTINSYTVRNMLLTVTGTENTYSTANYASASTATYIAPSGTTLTLASIYTIPTGATTSTFKGVSTGAPSGTAATVSTTAPTLSSNATYGMWFNRLTYTITATATTGGTAQITNERSQTSTASSGGTNTLTIRYGEKVTGSATAASGYTFTGWSGLSTATTATTTTSALTAAGTITATFQDKTAPTATVTTTSTLKSGSQTATLTCTDTVGVTKYYWGTSSDGTPATTVTSTKSMSTTTTVSSAGTYYLRCQDAAGNISTTTSSSTVTINSYTVRNMLLTVTGTENTYSTANYASASTATYIAPSGTTLTLASIYTIPTGATTSTFKGVSTGAPSGTAVTVSTTAPTLSSNATYGMWFNRLTYTITAKATTGGTAQITNERSQTSTASSGGTKTLTIRYGEKVTGSATAASGYTFTGWSGLSTATTATTTTSALTAAGTITASFQDKTAPTTPSIITMYDLFGSRTHSLSSSFSGSGSTLTSTGSDPYIQFLSVGNISGITGGYVELSTALTTAHNHQIFYEETSGFNETNSNSASFQSGTKKLYIPFTQTGSWEKIRFDFGSTSGVTFNVKHLAAAATANQWNMDSIILRLSTTETGSGMASWQYTYSSSATTTGTNSSSQWVAYDSSATTTFFPESFSDEGNKTIYVRACDSAGNCSDKASTGLKIDTTKPSCSISGNPTSWTNGSATLTVTGSDSGSSLASSAYSWTSSTSGFSTTQTKTVTANGTYTAYVTDNAGNVQSCSATVTYIDTTAPTKPTYTAFYDDGSGNYTSGNWANKQVNTTISTTEAGSGIASIKYSTDKSTWSILEFGESALTQNGTTWSGTEAWTLKNRNQTYYFMACDNVGLCSEVSDAYTIKYDIDKPTCELTSTNTLKVGTQTITATSATDTLSGISSYKFGTATASTTMPTMTATSAGAHTLTITDNAGNVGTCSTTLYSYKVYNMLLKDGGQNGTYSTTNYETSSTATYIAPSGTTLTLASIYTQPTGSVFKGVSSGVPSSTAVTVSTTAPTLTSNSNYGMWFDRNYNIIYVNGTTTLGTTTFTPGSSATLTKWSTLGGTISSSYTDKGWSFAGWTAGTTATATYVDGATVTLSSATTLKAVYTRNITYYSGYAATKTDATNPQYYNSNSTVVSAVTVPATTSIASIDYSWAPTGYRLAGEVSGDGYASSISPSVTTNPSYYAVYKRNVMFYSGVGATQTDATFTQYYNASGTNTQSGTTISFTPATISGWTYTGYAVASRLSDNVYSYIIYPEVLTEAKRYAVYSRSVLAYSGVSNATKSTITQYYNASGNISAVTLGTAATITDWTTQGYRDDTTATINEVTTSATPSVTATALTYYGVYKRNAVFNSGTASSTKSTVTQYYNSNGAYAVTSPSTATTISGWTTLGWRNDTTASSKEISLGSADTSSSATFYAVYSRSVLAYSGVSNATKSTITQYYNASGNISAVTLGTAATITDWTTQGYRDDTTATINEVTTSATPSVTATALTYYGVYKRNAVFNSGTASSTKATATQYYNSNGSYYVKTPSTAATITDWTTKGWRANTTATTNQTALGGANTSASSTFYAVYSRSVKFYSGYGSTKTDSTATQYYNSSGNIGAIATGGTSSIASIGYSWTPTGYRLAGVVSGDGYASNVSPGVTTTPSYYAVYKRSVIFYSGIGATKTDATYTQYYNSSGTYTVSTITITSTPATISGWTSIGYGVSTLYTNNAYSSTIKPTVLTTAERYAVYSRSIKAYSGVSNATKATYTQYYNSSSSTTTSTVTLATAATVTNWTTLGYRDDTTATVSEVTTSATPSVAATALTYYGVYSRTLTISYNANGGSGTTSSATKTVYLNSNQTTTSSQTVTLAANGFSKSGYRFTKWASGSTGGTQYSASASYSPALSYNATTFGTTMYAIWAQNNYSVGSTCTTTGTYYTDLASAVSGATAGYCITLLNARSESSAVAFNKNLTFNTNGKKLTTSAILTVNASISLAITGTGTITNSTTRVFNINDKGTLTLSSGRLEYTGTGSNVIYNQGKLNVSGGTIANTSTACTYSAVSTGSSSTTTGGDISITSGLIFGPLGLSVYGNSTITMSGGQIYAIYDSSPYPAIKIQEPHTGTTTISGGHLGSTSYSNRRAINNGGTTSVTMSGGSITTSGTVNAVLNSSTGTITLSAGTYSSGGAVITNNSTGVINIGKSSNSSVAKLTSSGTGAVVQCGNPSSGSKAYCRVYDGATITTSTGRGVLNYNGDYRQYAGSAVVCNGADYWCIYNIGSTYSTATRALTSSSSETCYYGRVFVRQGLVKNTVTAAIGSAVASANGVYIGNGTDTLYAVSSFTSASTLTGTALTSALATVVTSNKGPVIISTDTNSDGRGIYMDVDYQWTFKNGLVAGGGAFSNKYATNLRSSHYVNYKTISSISYAYLVE